MFVHAIQGMMPNKVRNGSVIKRKRLLTANILQGRFEMELCILHLRRWAANFGIHQRARYPNGI